MKREYCGGGQNPRDGNGDDHGEQDEQEPVTLVSLHPHVKKPLLPDGSISERELIAGLSKFEIKAAISKIRIKTRWTYRRTVIAGEAWYIPVIS